MIQVQAQVVQEALRRGWLTLVVELEGEVEQESQLRIARAADPEAERGGFRFQKCGGGRRVIRRQRGGAY